MLNPLRSDASSRRPLKSILKKASKVLKSDIAAAQYQRSPPFALPGSNTASNPKELHPRPRNSLSPPRQMSPPPQTSPLDGSLLQKLEETMHSIQREREEFRVKQIESRRRKLDQVLLELESKTITKGGEVVDDGSETEHGSYANNRLAMKLAVRQYVTDVQQREELLHLIDTSGTPRLSFLMRKQRVEGLYRQGPSGFVKVYGAADAPDTVQPGMVRKCFELKAETLAQVSQKQLWKADAFSL